MSDEKTPQDDVVDNLESAAVSTPAAPVQPTGKRRRRGATASVSEETVAATTEEEKKSSKVAARLRQFFQNIGQYFVSIVDQMRKVIWPTRKQLVISVITIFIFLVISVLLVFGVDSGAGELVRLIFQQPTPDVPAGPGFGLPGM